MNWGEVLGLLFGSFLGIETCALIKGTPTLSEKVREWSRSFPPLPFLITFAAGMCAGHFWWCWCAL